MNYFITSIYDAPGLFVHRKDRRTFGYFQSLDEAFKSVEENRCNMQECLYNYLVIEGIKEGIHPLVEKEHWYEWTDNKWMPCNKPEFLKSIINFALG